MQGLGAVAGQRAISTGTLLIALGGLALYQMTSLVLGPAGSRQLHLSLTLPSVDQEERNEGWTSGTTHALGSLSIASPAAPARSSSTVAYQTSATVGGHPASAPVAPVKPQPSVAPVKAQPAATPGVPDAKAAVHNGEDTNSGGHKGDETD